MTRWWGDTLFKRLFLLMWAALVGSHLLAYAVVHSLDPPHGASAAPGGGLPTLGSLPPGGPMPSLPPRGLGAPSPGQPPPRLPGDPGLPSTALWLDYGIRFLVMGVAAWFGARWLAVPVRRLGAASQTLAQAVAQHQPLPALDERVGTLEVRQAAQVFNAMARQLHQQFDTQSLLMAAISHDLRTPLARLRLRLEALPQAQAGRCIADVQQMDALIGSVLEMIRARHASAPPQRLDLLSLLQSLADDLAEQGHAVTLQAAPAVLVQARPTALARVLGNLLNNALRHGGGPVVASVERAGDAVRVHIDDAGPGIAPDQLAAVFQPFYRLAGNATGGTGESVGLGLYIARDLTERDGGQVTLANRADGGLRATVSLPRAR